MSVVEVKTCDTCTHRGSCDKAELGKPACVSYQVGYKKVVVIKMDGKATTLSQLADIYDNVTNCAKTGVLFLDKAIDIFEVEFPETFLCNDIIIETK